MAHGLENSIVKLDWPRDEQRGVVWLGGHLGRLGAGTEPACLWCWGSYTESSVDGVGSIEWERWSEIQVSGYNRESCVRSHDGDRGVQSAESHGYVEIAVTPDRATQGKYRWRGGFGGLGSV
jgi:hypothetical protein